MRAWMMATLFMTGLFCLSIELIDQEYSVDLEGLFFDAVVEESRPDLFSDAVLIAIG